MAQVARKYLPGYTGSCTIDTNSYPIQGWKSKADPGLFDTTTQNSGGWIEQEPGIQKVTFTFTILCKYTNGLAGFGAGEILPAVFSINGTVAYQGNVVISGLDTTNDLKGGVTFDVSADSQGAMTGALAPTIVTPSGS